MLIASWFLTQMILMTEGLSDEVQVADVVVGSGQWAGGWVMMCLCNNKESGEF